MDVARHRLQRDVERRRQLGDQQIFSIQSVEYRAPHRIGERTEHLVKGSFIGIGLAHTIQLTESQR